MTYLVNSMLIKCQELQARDNIFERKINAGAIKTWIRLQYKVQRQETELMKYQYLSRDNPELKFNTIVYIK